MSVYGNLNKKQKQKHRIRPMKETAYQRLDGHLNAFDSEASKDKF